MLNDLLGNCSKGLTFIVSAPAGSGKTTLVERLLKEFPNLIASVSFTTRAPRKGELQGLHYNFIEENEFEKKIADGEFLEYVRLYGTYYGTSREWIEEQKKKGKHVILVIDTQGALAIKKKIDAISIFIQPPSLDILRKRLVQRQTETVEMLEKRLARAQEELKAAQFYDYQIVNDDLETAYRIFKSIFIAECHRVRSDI